MGGPGDGVPRAGREGSGGGVGPVVLGEQDSAPSPIVRDAFGNRIRADKPQQVTPVSPREPTETVGPRKGRFEVRHDDALRGGWFGRILTGAALLFVVVVALQTGRAYLDRVDPHFIAARELVDDYERGRPATSRNYGDPVYQRALGELALVDPGAASVEQAEAMRLDLERRIAAFGERRTSTGRKNADRARIQDERHAAVVERRNRTVILPESAYEECDEDHAHDPGDTAVVGAGPS